MSAKKTKLKPGKTPSKSTLLAVKKLREAALRMFESIAEDGAWDNPMLDYGKFMMVYSSISEEIAKNVLKIDRAAEDEMTEGGAK